MKLLIIYGYPGTGKLTVANELSKNTNYSVFHNHLAIDLVNSIFDFGTIDFNKLREKIWLETFKSASEAGIDGLIFTFCFEKTISSSFVNDINKTLKSDDQILWVELCCDIKNLKERIEASNRLKYKKITSYDKVISLIQNNTYYKPKINDYVLEINNTDLSPEDVSRIIIEKYKIKN